MAVLKTGFSAWWRFNADRLMFSIMISRFERDDFSVVVKSRGQPPNPCRWEIYRAGRSSAVEQSATFFSRMTAAHKAGREALSRLLRQIENPDFE
jgi:hypothetical protein